MNLFIYDNSTNEVRIDQADVLLLREFSALWSNDRNITKTDKTGEKKSRAFKEIKYIYLMLDWKSPYSQYSEQERHRECLADAGLSADEFNDPIFREACRKYREIQESSRIGNLLKAQYNLVDKMILYFEGLDLEERDPISGKPIFKFKDIQSEIAGTSKMLEGIKSLEAAYKQEQEGESTMWGDAEPGFDD